jgi:Fe-S-cluster containining protein
MILEHKNYSFKFDSTACSSCAGNCCIGESGFIWITIEEIERLAKYLKIPVKDLFDNYLVKYDYKFSIKEKQLGDNNYACIFFDLVKKQCSIYDARPSQCRTFPFWEYFKNNIEELKKECPAIIE